MRRYARPSSGPYARVILYEMPEGGVYLFYVEQDEDVGCDADEWYASVDDAKEVAHGHHGIADGDWRAIPDPEANCQHDFIAPVRVVGRDVGAPQFGQLERREEGAWLPYDPRAQSETDPSEA